MSSDVTCEKLREIGAELALGVLPGREWAEAVAHLDRCAACREYVEHLVLLGDRLIGLLPDREPPLGFETRMARRLAQDARAQEDRPHPRAPRVAAKGFLRGDARRARLRIGSAAAALALGFGFAGWAVGTAVEENAASSSPATESETVLVGDLTSGGLRGQSSGEVYAHPGPPGWIFMSVALTGPGAPYTGKVACFLERSDGTTVRVGDFPLRDGRGDWGVAVPVDLTGYSAARLTSPDGTVLATAHLQKGEVSTQET